MVELQYNGQAPPLILPSNARCELRAFTNGAPVIPARWTVSAGGALIAQGNNRVIEFTPASLVVHTVAATINDEFGFSDVSVNFNVVQSTNLARAGVRWNKRSYNPGDALTATIVVVDSTGQKPSLITWSLQHNSTLVDSGIGSEVKVAAGAVGVYRVFGTASCLDGSSLSFDETAFVRGTFNARHSVPEPHPDGTLVYLGALYTNAVTGAAGETLVAPHQILSASQEIVFLPGTTHFSLDVVNFGEAVPEVVVRSKAGNWALNGYPAGLNGESIGYDYQINPAAISAPADLRAVLTVDAWVPRLDHIEGQPSKKTWGTCNFRVRIKCYTRTPNVYKYSRCSYSNYPGGSGRRSRKLAVLFTNIDVQTDAVSGLNRFGTADQVVAYSTTNVGNIPDMVLGSSGAPHPVPYDSGSFLTDSNSYAVYEAENAPDIFAKAVAGIEGLRPAYFTLAGLPVSGPTPVNRVKRIHGNLILLLTDGAVIKGEQITVKIHRGSATSDVTLTVPATIYVNEDSVAAKVAEAAVNISDFQFSETGVLMDIEVDSSGAEQSAQVALRPTPAPEHVYSRQHAESVSFDGACFTNPQYAPVFDTDIGGFVYEIEGCQAAACGPRGLYCYGPVYGNGSKVILPQPLGFPAPFIAYGTDPSNCYAHLGYVSEYSGTEASADLVAYPTNGMCGTPYLYSRCDSAYVTGYGSEIVVVYPPASSPHASVQHGADCYTYSGTITDYGTRAVVGSASVEARTGCADYYCSGSIASGSVVVYRDADLGLPVPVRFDHLETGIPHFAVSREIIDEGSGDAVAGQAKIMFAKNLTALLFTATCAGHYEVNAGQLRGINKSILIERAGQTTACPMGKADRRYVDVLSGDKVSISIEHNEGVPAFFRSRWLTVSWLPVAALPRLYDRVAVEFDSPTVVRALGFCGYTDQSGYMFYGTLPSRSTMAGALNPDSTVTIYNDGHEYLLLAVSGPADANYTNVSAQPYAGQALSGHSEFRFYACRTPAGAHGEMDVWYDVNGTLPSTLSAGNYRSLELVDSYAKESAVSDTSRNAYSAAFQPHSRLPYTYVAADGQIVSVQNGTDTFVADGKTFERAGLDIGISHNVIRLVTDNLFLSDNSEPWMSEDSSSWEL